MALTSINTAFKDSKDKVGGIRQMEIWEQVYTGQTAADSAEGTVGTGVITSYSSPSGASTIKFAFGTGKMDVNTTQEKGLALSTISIEGFVPNLSKVQINAFRQLVGKSLMAKVTLNAKYDDSGTLTVTDLLVGWDNVLGTQESTGDWLHSKFALFLESIEASTGAVMEDGVGATLKFTAVQGELPYAVEA